MTCQVTLPWFRFFQQTSHLYLHWDGKMSSSSFRVCALWNNGPRMLSLSSTRTHLLYNRLNLCGVRGSNDLCLVSTHSTACVTNFRGHIRPDRLSLVYSYTMFFRIRLAWRLNDPPRQLPYCSKKLGVYDTHEPEKKRLGLVKDIFE
jgi:hypothetical protein